MTMNNDAKAASVEAMRKAIDQFDYILQTIQAGGVFIYVGMDSECKSRRDELAAALERLVKS